MGGYNEKKGWGRAKRNFLILNEKKKMEEKGHHELSIDIHE
jgi:hypothetical protein